MQVYIADIVKSHVDWASKEAIVVFFAGCDFRCPYCFVPNLLDTKQEYLKDIKEVNEAIKSASYSCDAIYFTGGEPCLQKPALIEITKFSKQLDLKVGLQTNGSNPKVIKSLITDGYLNYLSLDLKAPFDSDIFEKTTNSKTFFKSTHDIMAEVKETLDFIKTAPNIEIDIRTTIIPSMMFNKEHLLRIAAEIKSIDCKWIFQQFQPFNNLVNKKLSAINPPSPSFLENLRETCLKVYPTLNIDIKIDNFNVI